MLASTAEAYAAHRFPFAIKFHSVQQEHMPAAIAWVTSWFDTRMLAAVDANEELTFADFDR